MTDDTNDDAHPEGCRCERCKRFRDRARMTECYPEEQRRLRHVRGQDSEPDPVLGNVPPDMTERQARALGLI